MATAQWMKHPDHGWVQAFSPREIKYNEANGWAKCAPLTLEELPNYAASKAVEEREESERNAFIAEALEDAKDDMEKGVLMDVAKKLGIEVDGRWGVDRLRAAIDAEVGAE